MLRASVAAPLALITYAAVILAYFLPVMHRLASDYIGDGGDNWQFAWNAWWTGTSLCAGRNPFYCDMQFAPTGVPLVLHTLAPIPSLAVYLLSLALPTALAYNLVVITLYPLAGLTAFALARRCTGHTLAAFVGGLAFMLCPFLVSKSLGHFNLQAAALLPLFVLTLLNGLDLPRPTRRQRAAITAVFLLILFSNVHTLIFAANITVWLWLYRGLKSRNLRNQSRQFWRLLRPVAAISILWATFVLYYMIAYDLDPRPYRNPVFSPEPLNYILPLHGNSWWHNIARPEGQLGEVLSGIELAVYLGWLVFPLAIVGTIVGRKSHPWLTPIAAISITALALSIGVKLQWHREIVTLFGHPIYMPMGLYRRIPILGSIGQAGRYLVITYMGMAVGIAALLAWIAARRGRTAGTIAALFVGIAICLDYGFRPLMIAPPKCPIPPGDGRVMDPRIGNPRSIYWQTFHGRPLVGGYIARVPGWIIDDYRNLEGIGIFFRNQPERAESIDAVAIRAGLDARHIEYITVATNSENARVLARVGLPVIHQTPWDTTFHVQWDGSNDRAVE